FGAGAFGRSGPRITSSVNAGNNTAIGSAFEEVCTHSFNFTRVGQIAWVQGFCITTKNGATAGSVAFSIDQSDGDGVYETFPGVDPGSGDNLSDAVESLPAATNAVENEAAWGHWIRCSTPGSVELTMYCKSAGVDSTTLAGKARISTWVFP